MNIVFHQTDSGHKIEIRIDFRTKFQLNGFILIDINGISSGIQKNMKIEYGRYGLKFMIVISRVRCKNQKPFEFEY